MEEMGFLLPVTGGFTPYGLMMAGGAVGALVLARILGGRKALAAGLCAALGAILGGHLAWGLVNLGFLDVYAEPGWLFLLQPWLGGTTLYGGLFGGLLGVLVFWVFTREKGQPSLLRTLDLLAPGACFALACGRAAEVFNGQGIGSLIEDESLQFFPLSVCTYADEDFSSWQVCVWFWEALAALCLLAALLTLFLRQRKHKTLLPDGRLAGIFFIVLSGSQIFFEQLRDDDALRFGFVISFTQIAAAVTITTVLAIRMVCVIREHRATWRDIFRLLTVAAGFLSVIFAEFVFDKPQFYTALIIAFSAEMGLACLTLHWNRHELETPIAISAELAGFALAAGLTLGKIDTDSEVVLIYGIILIACAVLSTVSLRVGTDQRSKDRM